MRIMLRDLKGQNWEEGSKCGKISPGYYFKDKLCISSPIIEHLTPKISQRKKSQGNYIGLKSKQVIKADRSEEELPYSEKESLT